MDKLTKKEVGKRGIILFLFVVLSMNIISAVDDYRPYLHKPTVVNAPELDIFGQYKTQLFPGSSSYNYNIIVPKGTNGLTPQLNIQYDSNNALKQSILGSGWQLTTNYIYRNVNNTIDNINDDYFVINMNGYSDKIFLINGVYKTLFEKDLKIENKTDNGNEYWLVTSKDGTRYRFGYFSYSLLPTNNGYSYNSKWYLDLINDTHGNTIKYAYLRNPNIEDKGTIYLNNITYNNDSLRRIFFYYESQARPDKRTIYDQGVKIFESRRLTSIEIYYNISLVRSYSIQYKNLNNELTLTSLSKISFIGSDNSSVLNSVYFNYYDSQSGFTNTTSWLVPEELNSISSGSKDLGLRIVDVNNDGFADIIKSIGTTNYTKLNDKNSNWVLTSIFSLPEQIVNSSNDYQGVEFVDVNKDGLVDILKSIAGTRRSYINNGSNWILNNNWKIPIDFVDNSSKDLGVRLIDINGDGLNDIVLANYSTKNIWLNNGTSWKNSSLTIPYYFIDSNGNDSGLRDIDLNGDGLSDLILGGIPGSAWINTGLGWLSDFSYPPNLNFIDYNNNNPDLGVRFMDINGDGLSDLIQNAYNNATTLNQTCYDLFHDILNCTYFLETNLSNVKINNGSGWYSPTSWQTPERFTYYGNNIGRRIADVNGDGYPDIIIGFRNITLERDTYLRDSKSSFYLKNITNEHGGTTLISYGQSSNKNNSQDLGFNIWIVINVTSDNSLSGSFAINSNNTYNYLGGKYDYNNSEFLGFNIVNETLADKTLIMHYFNQNYTLKGTEYLTKSFDKNGKHYKDSSNEYIFTLDNRTLLSSNLVYNYEGENPIITNISYKYDSYGNIILINYSGNINIQGDEKYELYGYTYNTVNHILNKVINYSLINITNSLVKGTYYYYDNQSQGVIKGDLTSVKNNYSNKNPSINYTYDSYGNVVIETDPKGISITYQYDSETNSFLIKKNNSLNQLISYYYDKGTGNLLSEIDSNGFIKNYTYDIYGRDISTILPYDDLTYPTKLITYYLNGSSPEKIKIETKNNNGSNSEQIFFYDGFSNPIQIKTKYNDNQQIVKNYLYDSKFRVVKEEDPFFATYSSNIEPNHNSLFSIYDYDALDRITNVTKSDNTSNKIIFHNSSVVSINENGIMKEYILDAYNRIIKVLEHNRNYNGANEIYNTIYSYDLIDNIILINDSQNHSIKFGFDSLGRKTYYDDSNTERWLYQYDLNNNLINQTDGRNITTAFAYDNLNRIINKSAKNGSDILQIYFYYDKQFNGTLSSINYTNYILDELRFQYIYDNRLRTAQEQIYFDYITGDDGNKKYWINTTYEYDSSDKILKKYLPSISYNYEIIDGTDIIYTNDFPNANIIYEYNYLGKIKKINNYLDNTEYNATGKIFNKTYNNTLTTFYKYDLLGRVINLNAGNIQNLTYSYDPVGNIKTINDSKNLRDSIVTYDDLDRLNSTIIHDYKTNEHERLQFYFDSLGNFVGIINDTSNLTYNYISIANAPSTIAISDRPAPRLELSLIEPTTSINIDRGKIFNFTTQVCCKDNDCWGVNVSLDPEEYIYTETSETTCKDGICSMNLYSGTRFVYEDGFWKKIEEARSLKGVWNFRIDQDSNYPMEIIDYNYTSVILNISVSKNKLNKNIPLKVFNKYNSSILPKDKSGNFVNKDRLIKINSVNDKKQVVIDLSDTNENLLNFEIKWGENSTETFFNDNNSRVNDTYINSVYGSPLGYYPYLYIRNDTTSQQEILLKFNLSEIPSDVVIDNALLNLYFYDNNLGSGKSYNLSIFKLGESYGFIEPSATWDNSRPNISSYDPLALDNYIITNSTSINSYLSWNVLSAISQRKSLAVSFYLFVKEMNTGSTGDIKFRSRENGVNTAPYISINYRFKGLVSNTLYDTPFYTTVQNPYFVDLEQNECYNITWPVTATGNAGDYIFYAFANKTFKMDIGNKTRYINVTINRADSLSKINILSPTPINNGLVSNPFLSLNFSINGTALRDLDYNWDDINYSVYNNSLVLMMNFDNRANIGESSTKVIDNSFYANNATINGATWTGSGLYNGAYTFDGSNDNMVVTDSDSLDVENMTISFWIKTNSNNTDIIRKWEGTGNQRSWSIYISSTGKLVLMISEGVNNSFFTSSKTTLIANQWYYITGRFNGSTISVYLNGSFEKYSNYTLSGMLKSTSNIKIGSPYNAANYFNGYIDELRIWNRSLTDQEILESYMINLNKYDNSIWFLTVNQTKNLTSSLLPGSHSYQVSCVDYYNNINNTEKRIVTITPQLDFISPTPSNSTSTPNKSIIINISIKESNLSNFRFIWNGTGFNLYNNSLVLMMNLDNISSFGEGNNNFISDNSIYSNNGNCVSTSGKCNWTNGKYNKGILLDGVSEYILIPNSSNLNMNLTTISLWIKLTSKLADEDIIRKWESTGNQRSWALFTNSMGVGRFQISFNGTNTSVETAVGTSVITDNNWHNIMGIHNGTAILYFVDGKLEGSKYNVNTTKGLFYSTSSIKIGDAFIAANHFNGTIDEVRIWNRSLSNSEIQEVYMSNLQRFNQTQWYFYVNQTKTSIAGLDTGKYTYSADSKNIFSNENTVEERTIIII